MFPALFSHKISDFARNMQIITDSQTNRKNLAISQYISHNFPVGKIYNRGTFYNMISIEKRTLKAFVRKCIGDCFMLWYKWGNGGTLIIAGTRNRQKINEKKLLFPVTSVKREIEKKTKIIK